MTTPPLPPEQRGESPLHIACANGSGPVVQYLVQAGVEIHQRNHAGLTPFHFSCSQGHSQASSASIFLLTPPSDRAVSPPARGSREGGHWRCSPEHSPYRRLFPRPPPSGGVPAGPRHGLALHQRCGEWKMESPSCSVSHSPPLQIGRTSLHWACQNGHVKVASYLVNLALASEFTLQYLTLEDQVPPFPPPSFLDNGLRRGAKQLI
jgi:ankyrin repeat protein